MNTSIRCCLFTALLWPLCTIAIEVEEIHVSSALNQLFDAKIPLPTLKPADLPKLSVKLAPPQMFTEFKIDRSPTLANFVFSAEHNAEGQVYVRIVSTKPIREPSLSLLLEFTWPRGKTYREFTVFLDPVLRTAKQQEVVPTPAPTVAVPAVTPPPPSKTYKPGDTYGPVVLGEGLWGIALKVRLEGISREEMVQALLRANPQAFKRPDPSGLKAGALLRIPTWREIADATGSLVALRLAEAEQPHPIVPHAPEVFALPKPEALEATIVQSTATALPVEIIAKNAPITWELKPPTPEYFEITASIAQAIAQLIDRLTDPTAPPLSIPAQQEMSMVETNGLAALADMEARIPQRLALAITSAPMVTFPVQHPPIDTNGLALLADMEARIPRRSTVEILPLLRTQAVPMVMQAPIAPMVPAREYGPIAVNERLWDVAARTRPDPSIGKDHMARALFTLNPHAFFKPDNMDTLKVGAILRVPTLQEIVDITGSKVAKQLLRQQISPIRTDPGVLPH